MVRRAPVINIDTGKNGQRFARWNKCRIGGREDSPHGAAGFGERVSLAASWEGYGIVEIANVPTNANRRRSECAGEG